MSKPKSSDYAESEVDKVNAAVAMADKQYFREKYLPKQKQFLEFDLILTKIQYSIRNRCKNTCTKPNSVF